MNMVLFNPDLNEGNFVPLCNFQTHILENGIDLICKHHSSVLGRAYQMIQQYRYVALFMDIFAHMIMLAPFRKPKQASGN